MPKAAPRKLGTRRGGRRRLALAVAAFNAELTDEMLRRAEARARELGFEPSPVVRVSGSYDLPFIVDRLLARRDVAAAVAIGVIVTGETKHDELIGHAAAKSLLDVAIARGKPVGLAITGPGQTYAQATARVDRAEHAVDAVARTLDALAELA